ncbi:hypothetical protein KSP40_PGU014215 [Platanthera guangdongensis]|uniref:Uncharacterized protein n=1 Tax=Platanthera guangdongensis TaxID=2320717 RepID=A0ABR2MIH9_9ASPA
MVFYSAEENEAEVVSSTESVWVDVAVVDGWSFHVAEEKERTRVGAFGHGKVHWEVGQENSPPNYLWISWNGSHNTHFCLPQSLDAVRRIRPKRALFIGMTHDFEHFKDNKALKEWSNSAARRSRRTSGLADVGAAVLSGNHRLGSPTRWTIGLSTGAVDLREGTCARTGCCRARLGQERAVLSVGVTGIGAQYVCKCGNLGRVSDFLRWHGNVGYMIMEF